MSDSFNFTQTKKLTLKLYQQNATIKQIPICLSIVKAQSNTDGADYWYLKDDTTALYRIYSVIY